MWSWTRSRRILKSACWFIGGTPNFAAGADIKSMVECDPEGAKKFSFSPTYHKLMNLAIPTIASIGGYCFGGGMELALTCDLRIAADNAKMGLVETNLGIFPGAGGTIRLPRLIGYSRALEMIIFGKVVKGPEALEMGIVNRVVPKDDLWEETMKWAKSCRCARRWLYRQQSAPSSADWNAATVAEGVDIEAEEFAICSPPTTRKRACCAFIEKRDPVYLGK